LLIVLKLLFLFSDKRCLNKSFGCRPSAERLLKAAAAEATVVR